MESIYKYLFPFEKVPKDSNILIYGAGILGQEYLKQISITKYCKVVGFVDKNFIEYKNSSVPVYAPKRVRELEFDFVVIALRGSFAVPSVKKVLHEQGVGDEKMVCVLERIFPQNAFNEQASGEDELQDCLSISSGISFALFMSGGIGDMVTYKRFVEELHQLVPDAKMDIFTVRGVDFLKWLYFEEDYINNILSDLGRRYNDHKEKYSLALSFIGSGLLNVDFLKGKDFLPSNECFIKRIEKLRQRINEDDFSIAMPAAIMFYRRIYRGENCYTGFNHGDIFSIKDKQIRIPFLERYKRTFLQLGLGKYITINIENGTGNENKDVAKTWPKKYFIIVVKMIKRTYPDVSIIQIGSKDGPLLEHADQSIMGKDFGLVAEVLRNALFHIDIEGGLVHLASQIGTKCIVLFGPTPSAYFAYENNINIQIGDCHGCYSFYQDAGRCAKGMKEPKCMYEITPTLVMEHIDKYMRSRKAR